MPPESFDHRLFLIYGDQKTVHRIRSIKRRRKQSRQAYDSLKWALPVPALFHLKMNYLYMLQRSHFGGAGDSDQSTLYDAMNYWDRKGDNVNNIRLSHSRRACHTQLQGADHWVTMGTTQHRYY